MHFFVFKHIIKSLDFHYRLLHFERLNSVIVLCSLSSVREPCSNRFDYSDDSFPSFRMSLSIVALQEQNFLDY